MSTGGLLTGSLRDIEKQFGFTSKQTGFIIVSNDIAALLAVPVVSFYGERGNKPKWIGFGALLCGNLYKICHVYLRNATKSGNFHTTKSVDIAKYRWFNKNRVHKLSPLGCTQNVRTFLLRSIC